MAFLSGRGVPLHHIGRWTLVQQFVFHKVHVGSYVVEELLKGGAEIVEAGLSISSSADTILRTASIAGKLPLAQLALVG